MVELASRRSEFTVMIADPNQSSAKRIADSLGEFGYGEIHSYSDFSQALLEAKAAPPHVVLVMADLSASEAGADSPDSADRFKVLESFLNGLKAISEEILPIVLLEPSFASQGLHWVERNISYDTLLLPLTDPLELVQKVDRAIARLYYQFESEQLRAHFASLGRAPTSEPKVDPTLNPKLEPKLVLSSKVLKPLTDARELDESVRVVLEMVAKIAGHAPVLYLRYLPTHFSLLFSQAVQVPEENFRGIGIDIKNEIHGLERHRSFFYQPGQSELLRVLVRAACKSESYLAFTHWVDQDEPTGLILVLGDVAASAKGQVQADIEAVLQVFEVVYLRNLLTKEKFALETVDPATGLLNRREFGRALDEEISRSRRLMLPVAVVLMSIDGWQEVKSKLGDLHAETLLRPLALLMRKTCRANDVLARSGADEFVMILPHTPQMGAALKAERFRRMVETMKLPAFEKLGVSGLTISCGVSEYPSFAFDSEGLIRSADEALHEVKRTGKNKVCLASAPDGFQPDFVPRESPNPPRIASGGRV